MKNINILIISLRTSQVCAFLIRGRANLVPQNPRIRESILYLDMTPPHLFEVEALEGPPHQFKEEGGVNPPPKCRFWQLHGRLSPNLCLRYV